MRRHGGFAVATALLCIGEFAFGDSGDANNPRALDDRALRQIVSTSSTLLVTALLILIFVVVSYLLLRIGKSVKQAEKRAKPTEFVDAWSNYRVTDAEIAAATYEPADQDGGSEDLPPGDGGPPDDDEPDKPERPRPSGR